MPGPVADRSGTEREPASSERMLRALIDHMPAMIGYWNRELRNVIANAAYVEWFGLTPERMAGVHIRDVIGPDLYAQNLPYIEGALAGQEQHFDRTIIDASGTTRYSQATYVPDRDASGEVQGFFVLVADVTARVLAEQELAAAKDELERRATTDPLTGLANRALLEQRVDLALAGLERAEPGTRALGLIMIDLDGFKPVNDQLGHEAGDQLLVELATRLGREIREPDLAARLGGDEFVVLLPGLTSACDADVVADRVATLLRTPVALPTFTAQPLCVTASVGCTTWTAGRERATFRTLLRNADALMYQAKKRGGDQWSSDGTHPHTVQAPAPRSDTTARARDHT